MTESESAEALIHAVEVLSERMEALIERLDVPVRQQRWTRALTAVLAVVVFVGSLVGGVEWYRVNEAIKDNAHNAVQQCENDNQDRAATRTLWGFILDQSAAEAKTPQEVEDIEAFREWTEVLYAPRDCEDPSQVYEIPPPPDLGE